MKQCWHQYLASILGYHILYLSQLVLQLLWIDVYKLTTNLLQYDGVRSISRCVSVKVLNYLRCCLFCCTHSSMTFNAALHWSISRLLILCAVSADNTVEENSINVRRTYVLYDVALACGGLGVTFLRGRQSWNLCSMRGDVTWTQYLPCLVGFSFVPWRV